MMIKHKLKSNFLAGLVLVATSVAVQAQTAGTTADSTTESKGFAAGRHADGGTGVRKAQSTTSSATGGTATGSGTTSGSTNSGSTVGTGGSATAGSGVSASTLGTGGSSATTQSKDSGTASSATGTGASATASGPSGTSSSGPSGSKASPTRGASGYAQDSDKSEPPGQTMKKDKSKKDKKE